ncbi:hypothetical protein KIPB_010157, partial [Kipferlia bialata]
IPICAELLEDGLFVDKFREAKGAILLEELETLKALTAAKQAEYDAFLAGDGHSAQDIYEATIGDLTAVVQGTLAGVTQADINPIEASVRAPVHPPSVTEPQFELGMTVTSMDEAPVEVEAESENPEFSGTVVAKPPSPPSQSFLVTPTADKPSQPLSPLITSTVAGAEIST